MNHRNLLHCLIFLPILFVLTTACEKFSGDQSIPAYLSIDSLYITTDYSTQGTASQSVTDAWVYIDDELIGAFELPARFPVLKSGSHVVKIYPGVKKNGIAATRTEYAYFLPILKTIKLKEDSTTKLGTMKSTYQSTALFDWMEDFESISMTLDTTSRSSAYIQSTPAGSPLTFEGNHSGKVVMDSIHDYFECVTHNEYDIPNAPVFLEMNFNTSNSLTVGVYSYSGTTIYQTPILTLNPTNGAWKKIYIDLTTTLNAYTGMQSFRVYFSTFKEASLKESMILFDNFKIVTRKSS
ncbi:MAG: hypothetical protein PHF97_08135 [Bacteroidales bacterium]|nr:hypothetical protein [Bacteroidales bacterium]